MALRTLDQLIKKPGVKGKKVLVRADINVPMHHGKVTDDTRIRTLVPTLERLLKEKARVIPLNWPRDLSRIAASIALIAVGLTAGIWYGRDHSDQGMAMAEVSPEYAELERCYEHDISGKKEKLASFTGSQSADVLQDLDQLDRIMEELRQELAAVPP